MQRPGKAELERLYLEERKTTRQVGQIFGVSHTSIKNWLRDYGIPKRPPSSGLAYRGITAPTRDELVDMVHGQHLTYYQIAAKYGVDFTAVPYWLKKHGIRRPTAWETRRKGNMPTLPTAEQAIAEYETGVSLDAIGERYGVSAGPIRQLFDQYGIEVIHAGWKGKRLKVCADGHLVRSSHELKVDNWLAEHGLDHEVDPVAPIRATKGRFLADFQVGNTYVEVWGVTGSKSYQERRQRKVALYRKANVPLIELPLAAFRTDEWARRLSALLPKDVQRAA